MTALQVIECGAATSVQDGGRIGYRRYGVAMSGAMDLGALALANARVGNRLDMAALEFAFVGGRFQAVGGDLQVAIAGSGCTLAVGGAVVSTRTCVHVSDGEEIAVGPIRQGVYGYLAVAGGFALEPELGSCSVHRRSGIGGRPLAAKDELPCLGSAHFAGWPVPSPTLESGPIRVMTGPQDDHFRAEALEMLLSAEFTVLPVSDRMGIKLDGPVLRHARGGNIISDGVLPGNIQVPGDERPVVLMRDCQTCGGYPKIATVIGADLDRLAQVPPGDPVRFEKVSRQEAVLAARVVANGMVALREKTGNAAALPSSSRLFEANLIDGIVDAQPPDYGESEII